jgi:excinuclease ABC subunit A
VALLEEIGLGYLSLDRAARTLSGGELQRVQLVAALATGLAQVLYVLDEPSIGLHARDNDRLLRILERLKSAGNTVVVVEHDPALILAADVLVDLGPGAGEQGGQLIGCGRPEEVLDLPLSLTGDYLRGRRQVDTAAAIPVSRKGRPLAPAWLTIRQPTARTLRGQDVRLQLGALNAVCGVSGSGKSTLVEEVLFRGLQRLRGEPVDEPGACAGFDGAEAIRAVVLVDQELPAASSRANCATYLKVWDAVRTRLAAEPLAVQRGYGQATFSFNRDGGRCPACEGLGIESVEMQFLSDVHMTCESCGGKRFRSEVLQVRHRGLDAAGFLERTAQEIADQFQDDPGLSQPMRALCELGLGYLRLGQPLSTLSGGEAQRLKIAWHLLQARTKGALFILDEPSTGLHLHDVAVLLANLRRLVAQGNTVLLVEHHLDLLQAADHLVELGPDGGPGGGQVLFQGPPVDLLAQDTPTATYLRQHRARPEEIAAGGLAYRRTPGLGPDAEAQVDPGCVQIRGARVHNLKNLNLDVPRDRFTVVTGVSGSGKSSLAFDVVFAEGQRRFLDCLSPYARQYLPPALQPDVDQLLGLPPTVAIAQRTTRGGLKSTVATLTDLYPYLRLLYARCGVQRCPHCGGAVTGQSAGDVVAAIRERYPRQPALYVTAPAVRGRKGHHKDIVEKARQLGHQWLQVDGSLLAVAAVPELRRFASHDLDWVVARLTPDQLQDGRLLAQAVDAALALGDGTLGTRTHDQPLQAWSLRRHCASCQRSVEPPDPRLFAFTSAAGWCRVCEGTGVQPAEEKKKPKAKHQQDGKSAGDLAKAGLADGGEAPPDEAQRRLQPCHSCQGARLRPEARSVTLGGLSIDQAASQGPRQLGHWLAGLEFSKRDQMIVEPIAAELQARCAFLTQVGLDYLGMHRGAVSLSGGESQRLRLAAQLSSNLRGVLYVLDEPTIGLHPTDNQKVLAALEQLVARGNGLLVVEHDEDTIRRADHLIELGPSGGRQGGELLYQGTIAGLLASGSTPTGAMLAAHHGRWLRQDPRPVAQDHRFIELLGANRNNLRNVDARFARGRFNAVTGVSGSGKSTLVRDLLVEYGNLGVTVTDRRTAAFAGNSELRELRGIENLGRVVEIDQSPIGRTPRSCPATYIGVWDAIRQAFAALPEAKVAGLQANQFSFNVEGGRCPLCLGGGALKVEMSFLPSTRVPCEACGGKRFADHVLQVRYKGASVADVLAMSLAEAAEHFRAVRQIAAPLELAARMGLDYLQLGQGSDTLSGGEAQRIKIVTELAKKRRVETLYVLDEPTTGLHLQDVQKLLTVLQELVERGDTLVVIEHHMDLVRQADWLVDMGPGPGEMGGAVTFEGTVEAFLHHGPQVPTRVALMAQVN